MSTVLVYAVPYLFTVAIAFGVAMLAFLQYRLAARVAPEIRLVSVVLVMGIGALLSVVLTSRTLDETALAAGVIATYDDFAKGFAASRWLSLVLVATSLIEIVRGWVRARAVGLPDPATPVLMALVSFYGGTLFVQAALSDFPGFSFRSLYVPLVLLGVYYQWPRRPGLVLAAAKGAILLVTTGSLVAMVLRPDFAIHHPDPGWIPGLDWRLYGVTPHANSLGPIALLAIALELHEPSRWRALRWLHLLAAAAVFVLAQSKTAWVAAPVMLVVVYVPLALRRSLETIAPMRRFDCTVWVLLGAIAVLVLVAGGIVVFDVPELIRRRTDLTTLTGRTQIWDITIQAWKDNMLFGYGPEIWGPERQLRFGMFHVGHAHNQLVQSLGEAGLAGLGLLLLYLGTLFHAAMRCFVASRGIVLLLLVLLLVRCVTEAPMSREGLLSWDTFLHVILFATACHYLRASAPDALARTSFRSTLPATERGRESATPLAFSGA